MTKLKNENREALRKKIIHATEQMIANDDYSTVRMLYQHLTSTPTFDQSIRDIVIGAAATCRDAELVYTSEWLDHALAMARAGYRPDGTR